jgi:hypothetical protein
MKAHGRTQAVSALVFGIAFLFTGCDFFAGLSNPLIGTWRTTVHVSSAADMVLTLDIHADKSLEITGTLTGSTTGSVSGSGTFTQDSSAETITIDGSMTTTVTGRTPTRAAMAGETIAYSISTDKNTMTWIDSSGVLTGTPGAAVVWLRK